MAQEQTHPKYLAPGTIDATRKNIGTIDPEEALKMTKVLGGEIMTERPFDINSTPLSHTSKARQTRVQKAQAQKAQLPSNTNSSVAKDTNKKLASSVAQGTQQNVSLQSLPPIPRKELNKMTKLMREAEYGIKTDYGLFNFMAGVLDGSSDKVAGDFVKYTLKNHIEHVDAFVNAAKSFIDLCHDALKKKIQEDMDLKYKFIRAVCSWDTADLTFLWEQLEKDKNSLTVQMFVPFEKELYKMVLTVFYIGEQRGNTMLKDLLQEATGLPNAQKAGLTTLISEMSSQWFYICTKIVHTNYPLLMRMCCATFEPYPDFFSTKFSNILTFLGVSKFDLLMIQKAPSAPQQDETQDAPPEEKHTSLYQKKVVYKDELVTAGLSLLERLFPKAGFSNIEDMPDLFPYFYPIYNFEDGYNMLSPNNPMQITVVLLEIIEELFQGCRNIKFEITSDDPLSSEKDTIQAVINEWSLYREVIYAKNYNEDLKNYVNQLYSQNDYDKSQYGKKTLSNILWSTRYYFLPYYKFEKLVLEQPANDNKYRALFLRTSYIKKLFRELGKRIDRAAKDKGSVIGILNPWEKYSFDIPNNISKRLDVLLGAKKRSPNACNANLLKYTLCIISVLDWWLNAQDSPAYSEKAKRVYRISKEDGKPVFSVPLVKNQNQLFIQSIKARIQQN